MVQRSPRLSTRTITSFISMSYSGVASSTWGRFTPLTQFAGSTSWTRRPCSRYVSVPLNDSTTSTIKHHFIHGWSILYTREGINNSQNSQMWSHGNQNLITVINLQRRFSVHVWCGLLSKKVTGQQFNRWQVLNLHEDDLLTYLLHGAESFLRS